MAVTYSFKAKLWMYDGEGAWFFVTLPQEYADEIKMITSDVLKSGFGSVKVLANCGSEQWATLIFPDKKSKSYVLPIKKQIRTKLNVKKGDILEIKIALQII